MIPSLMYPPQVSVTDGSRKAGAAASRPIDVGAPVIRAGYQPSAAGQDVSFVDAAIAAAVRVAVGVRVRVAVGVRVRDLPILPWKADPRPAPALSARRGPAYPPA